MSTSDEIKAAAERLLARARTVAYQDRVSVWADDIKIVAYAALKAVERERRLVDALEASKISHLVVDGDPWFDCPDGSRTARGYHLQCDKPCNCQCTCGADEHNMRIDAALAAQRTAAGERET